MSIDWFELFIGGCIGGLVGFSVQKMLEISVDFGGNRHFPYIGTFHSYHYSTSGTGEIIHSIWKTRKRFDRKIELVITEPEEKHGFKYKGILWVEERHIYAQLKGVSHIENLFFIFPEPVNRQIGITIGVAAALTMKKNPWCGKELLCGKQVSTELAKDLLGSEQKIVSTFSWKQVDRLNDKAIGTQTKVN